MLKEGVTELLSPCQGLKVMINLVWSWGHRVRGVTLNFAIPETQACELIQNWIALWKGTFIHQTLNMFIHSSETIAQERIGFYSRDNGSGSAPPHPLLPQDTFLFPRKCVCIYIYIYIFSSFSFTSLSTLKVFFKNLNVTEYLLWINIIKIQPLAEWQKGKEESI